VKERRPVVGSCAKLAVGEFGLVVLDVDLVGQHAHEQLVRCAVGGVGEACLDADRQQDERDGGVQDAEDLIVGHAGKSAGERVVQVGSEELLGRARVRHSLTSGAGVGGGGVAGLRPRKLEPDRFVGRRGHAIA